MTLARVSFNANCVLLAFLASSTKARSGTDVLVVGAVKKTLLSASQTPGCPPPLQQVSLLSFVMIMSNWIHYASHYNNNQALVKENISHPLLPFTI